MGIEPTSENWEALELLLPIQLSVPPIHFQ